jgi:glycosyltransferase involved in cell wall biosynthesis
VRGPSNVFAPKIPRSAGTIRVLQILFDDRFGGPQKRIFQSVAGLEAQGVHIIVALPDRGGNAHAIARNKGIETRIAKMAKIPRPSRIYDVLRWVLTLPGELRALIRLIREVRPNVVTVNGAILIVPAMAARLTGVPVVMNFNDTSLPAGLARLFGRIDRKLADLIVSQGDGVARHYGLKAGQYVCIYSAVDTAQFCPFRERQGARLRIGLIANWNPIKNIESYVEAARQIAPLEPAVDFLLAGPKIDTQAEYARRIEHDIAAAAFGDRLTVSGAVQDVPAFMNTLDIVVMCSLREGCPNVVLEAMACGRPVVATDVGCVRELLDWENEPAGIVVPVHDPAALGNALRKIAGDPLLREKLGNRGRALAQERYALDAHVTCYAALYRKLVTGAKV